MDSVDTVKTCSRFFHGHIDSLICWDNPAELLPPNRGTWLSFIALCSCCVKVMNCRPCKCYWLWSQLHVSQASGPKESLMVSRRLEAVVREWELHLWVTFGTSKWTIHAIQIGAFKSVSFGLTEPSVFTETFLVDVSCSSLLMERCSCASLASMLQSILGLFLLISLSQLD